LPFAAEEEREAEHEQEVADDATRQRTSHDLFETLVDGEERDDQLRRVTKGRVQEAADSWAGVVSGVLRRVSDQPGERDEREGRHDEEGRLSDANAVEDDDERPEREQRVEDFARQGARTLTSPECSEPCSSTGVIRSWTSSGTRSS
jgi:hypothetical protein